MGKKLNLAYRERIAQRATLRRCNFCGRRSARLDHDVIHGENYQFHRSCEPKLRDRIAAQLIVERQDRDKRKAAHAAIHEHWINPPLISDNPQTRSLTER